MKTSGMENVSNGEGIEECVGDDGDGDGRVESFGMDLDDWYFKVGDEQGMDDGGWIEV